MVMVAALFASLHDAAMPAPRRPVVGRSGPPVIPRPSDVDGDRLEQAFLGERLGEVLIRSHHAPARTVEQPVLRREHDDRRRVELRVLLDQRARLVAIEARHHDIDKDQVGLMVGDLGERVEAVLREDHRAPGLQQKYLGAAAYGVRIVDHHDLDARDADFAPANRPPVTASRPLFASQRAAALIGAEFATAATSCLEHKSFRNRRYRRVPRI